jgi:hypothetical protein
MDTKCGGANGRHTDLWRLFSWHFGDSRADAACACLDEHPELLPAVESLALLENELSPRALAAALRELVPAIGPLPGFLVAPPTIDGLVDG